MIQRLMRGYRVLRGASFGSDWALRFYNRARSPSEDWDEDIGFRLVVRITG